MSTSKQYVAEDAGGKMRRDVLRDQRKAASAQSKRHQLILIIAIIIAFILGAGAGVGGMLLWGPSGDPGAVTPMSEQDPPDGDENRSWIQVPSDNTKPNALIVDIHTDPQCPICKYVENFYAKLFAELSERGDIVIRQHTRIFLDGNLGNVSSTKIAMAAACVDIVDRTKYAAFLDTVFINQPQEGLGFSDNQISVDFPTAIGLADSDLATYQNCLDSQATLPWVLDVEQNNVQAVANPGGSPKYLYGGNYELYYDENGQLTDDSLNGIQGGVHGTPTFFVNGVRFGTGELFDLTNGQPLVDNANDLLLILKTKANS